MEILVPGPEADARVTELRAAGFDLVDGWSAGGPELTALAALASARRPDGPAAVAATLAACSKGSSGSDGAGGVYFLNFKPEAEEALRPEMGEMAGWYLDLQDASRRYRQEANSLVEDLSGRPAMSLAQWAARNRSLFAA